MKDYGTWYNARFWKRVFKLVWAGDPEDHRGPMGSIDTESSYRSLPLTEVLGEYIFEKMEVERRNHMAVRESCEYFGE